MRDFVKVATKDEIPQGEGKVVEVDGERVALFNVEGEFYAIDNTCVHQGGPLGEGYLEEKVVTCPWHGWQYDVTSGVSPLNPAARVAAYSVRVDGDDVLVSVETGEETE